MKLITRVMRYVASAVVDFWTSTSSVGRHYWVTKDGVHQCAYCQVTFAETRIRERCPVFE